MVQNNQRLEVHYRDELLMLKTIESLWGIAIPAVHRLARSISISFFGILLVACPLSARAVTLDQLFSQFGECKFSNFYYAPWDKQPVHPYFAERNLVPYKEISGLYYFKVKDTLFGMPVSEIFVPGTWDYHGVVFDVPLKTAQKVLKDKFGTAFGPSDKSSKGERPALDYFGEESNKSILFCAQHEGGM